MEKNLYIYFTDYFGISDEILEKHGAFNISLVTDLPLFIDPFLLFNSKKPDYQELHDSIIRYLRFLKRKSEQGGISPFLMQAWYYFSEVKQNWLGFSETGNSGRGLGRDFAQALDANLVTVFSTFGKEKITRGSHLEKLCLIKSGVGRDMISDFTTNLIKDYLLTYTAKFAAKHVSRDLRKLISVPRAYFSYETERWMPKEYTLPYYDDDFVILTPRDMLTKDDTWINHRDMIHRFEEIPNAVPDGQLRAEINNYLYRAIPQDRKLTNEDYDRAFAATIQKYPSIVDYYIKMKEDTGDRAASKSLSRVHESYYLYIKQFGQLALVLDSQTPFYQIPGDTESETRQKIEYFKDVIENKGGHRMFYGRDGQPIRSEGDLHIMFRLVWHRTPSDVSTEVNDGRGPADFKISRGAVDKTLVEFKLASNSQLKRNLEKQLEIYRKASDAQTGFKVVVYFTEQQLIRIQHILNDLGLQQNKNIILIDARDDNKPSGSKA